MNVFFNLYHRFTGAQSIRAYGLKNKFIIQSEEKVDFNQKSYYPNLVSNRYASFLENI